MPTEEILRKDGESINEFQVRTLLAKENGELDVKWRDIADIFGCNEDNIRRIAKGVKLYDVVMSGRVSGTVQPELSDDHIEILKERVRAHDERVSFNRDIRGVARYEQKLDLIEAEIRKQGDEKYPAFSPIRKIKIGDKVCIVVVLSDWHIGAEFYSISGRYNSKIALARLGEYLGEIQEIVNRHGVNCVKIVLIGDMISGNIHKSISVTNREDVITQLMVASDYIADFVYHVAKMEGIEEVDVNGVTGNHSRLGKKDETAKNERLERIIPWYLSAKLYRIRNVTVHEPLDPTIDVFEVLGYKFFAVHGDLDPFTEDGVQDIMRMMKERPYIVLFGHKHYPAFMECSGIKAYQSGCLSGTGDDYSLERRFNSPPNQTVLVMNQNGLVCPYFIELGHSEAEGEMCG